MNRRDLIKYAVSIGALCGIAKYIDNKKSNNTNINNKEDGLKIVPKQTSKYIFSAACPLSFQSIDQLIELNAKVKKSQIKSLYNSIPFSTPLDIYSIPKGINIEVQNLKTFLKYVRYAVENDFEFIYTLNSPKPFLDNEYAKTKKELIDLVKALNDAGCNKFRIGNTQVVDILLEHFPSIELSASTGFCFNNVGKYQNLVNVYPNIKWFDIDTDENKNFDFLLSLKKSIPDATIELLVNDPCPRACPGKISHLSSNLFVFDCMKQLMENFYKEFCKSGVIYPWNLEYYSAIGINNFKLVSKPIRGTNKDISKYRNYLIAVDKGYEVYQSASQFFNEVFRDQYFCTNPYIKLADIIEYLPDIRHFIKNGSKCSNNCESTCHYCEHCGDILKKRIEALS